MVTTELDKKSVQALVTKLNNIVKALKYKEALKDSTKALKYEAEKNIDTQGFYYGTFKPLKESTRRSRARRGYGAARPILVNSGKLKKSFIGKVKSDKEAYVTNKTDYVKFHQSGTKHMPARKILGTTKKSKTAIGLIFANYIAKIIRKSV